MKSTRITPDINAYAASFTPDGKYLVYTTQEKGKESVWLKDLNTNAATQIQPPSDEGYFNPTISRNNFLYFMSRRQNLPNNTIIRVPLNGGGEQIVATDLTSPFTLSPDEKQLAFINGKWQIMIAATDGNGEPRILARRDAKNSWYESWSSRLSWSPDGKSIAVCGGRKKRKRQTDSGIDRSQHGGRFGENYPDTERLEISGRCGLARRQIRLDCCRPRNGNRAVSDLACRVSKRRKPCALPTTRTIIRI